MSYSKIHPGIGEMMSGIKINMEASLNNGRSLGPVSRRQGMLDSDL